MKISQDEFLKLQKLWYDRLKESGFNDIEELNDGTLHLCQSSIGIYQNATEVTKTARMEYYTLLHHKVEDPDTHFRDETDKHILTRHSQGVSFQKISNELTIRGDPKTRRTIRFIIRRYVMKWKIRTYTRKQLNLKPLPPIQS